MVSAAQLDTEAQIFCMLFDCHVDVSSPTPGLIQIDTGVKIQAWITNVHRKATASASFCFDAFTGDLPPLPPRCCTCTPVQPGAMVCPPAATSKNLVLDQRKKARHCHRSCVCVHAEPSCCESAREEGGSCSHQLGCRHFYFHAGLLLVSCSPLPFCTNGSLVCMHSQCC